MSKAVNGTTISFSKIGEISNDLSANRIKISDNIDNVVNTVNTFINNKEYFSDQGALTFLDKINTFNVSFKPFLEETDEFIKFLSGVSTDYNQLENSLTNEANSIDDIMPIAGAAAATGAKGLTLSEIESYKDSLSTIPVSLGAAAGVSLVANALKYVGNPYVWGGTDLNKGADCSGFTLALCKQLFGIDLPHSAAAQSKCGTAVSGIAEAQPGDLLFYRNSDGRVSHVTIYMGNGMEVEAKGRKYGIVSEKVTREPAIIRRVC